MNVLVAVDQDNGLLNSILLREKDMKRKLPLSQEIYLPDYFSDIVSRTFEKSLNRESYTGILDIMKMESNQDQEYFCMLKEEYGNPCLSKKILSVSAVGYYF